MKYIFATTALASALAFGTFAAGNLAKAEDTNAPPCVGEQCPQGGGMKGGGEQMPGMKGSGEENQGGYKKRLRGTGQNNQVEDQSGDDQGMPRKKRLKAQGNDNDDVDVNVQGRVKVGQGDKWRFDPGQHHRRRHRDATFRFYLDGFWYEQPYWEVYSVRTRYGVSCGQGRAIVSERFNRVRVVECNGGTYTYLGRRQGDTYRILLNARTGRIIDRELI